MGVAYVRFALTHSAHFEVMYQPAIYDAGDPTVRDARAAAADLLYGSRDRTEDETLLGVAAWSIVMVRDPVAYRQHPGATRRRPRAHRPRRCVTAARHAQRAARTAAADVLVSRDASLWTPPSRMQSNDGLPMAGRRVLRRRGGTDADGCGLRSVRIT